MKFNLKNLLTSLTGTILLLVLFEIISTAFLPALGLENYKIAMDVLIVLYLGFRLDSPYLALFILLIQLFHSAFSVEGWAFGTFTGVIVCMVIGYVKDHLQFSSAIGTMILTQIFQVLWFVIISLLFYFQTKNLNFIELKLWHFIPESLLLSLFSPIIFTILDKFWSRSYQAEAGI